jgi:hypothetical protein
MPICVPGVRMLIMIGGRGLSVAVRENWGDRWNKCRVRTGDVWVLGHEDWVTTTELNIILLHKENCRRNRLGRQTYKLETREEAHLRERKLVLTYNQLQGLRVATLMFALVRSNA